MTDETISNDPEGRTEASSTLYDYYGTLSDDKFNQFVKKQKEFRDHFQNIGKIDLAETKKSVKSKISEKT